MTDTERAEILQDWTDQVAEALTRLDDQDHYWDTAVLHEWGTQLVRDDGLTLNVIWRRYPAGSRADIYPDDVPDFNGLRLHYGKPEIGISVGREARAAAQDIRRRLLPDAEAFHKRNLARNAKHLARHERGQLMADTLKLATNGSAERIEKSRVSGDPAYAVERWNGLAGKLRFQSKVDTYEGKVNITIENLDLEAACEILALLSAEAEQEEMESGS